MYDYTSYPPYSSGPAPIPTFQENTFYPDPEPSAMMGSIPLQPTPTDPAAKAGFLDPMANPWSQYPHFPGDWCPQSPYDAAFSDTQSSQSMSSPRLLHDSLSPVTNYSSPSPYPEISHVAHFEHGHGSTICESRQNILPDTLHPKTQPDTYHQSSSGRQNSYAIEHAAITSASNSSKSSRKTSTPPKKETRRATGRVRKVDTPQKPKKKATRKNNPTGPRVSSQHTNGRKSSNCVFECTFSRYGCASKFPSKNEWKRHVSSQHIQPDFYRCDMGRCELNNGRGANQNSEMILVNDFNRKDLFIQHQRRMHAPWVVKNHKSPVSEEEKQSFEQSLELAGKRCLRQQRSPPSRSQCLFCQEEFHGVNAWREGMEHIARHYETAHPGPGKEDLALREWAIEHRVIQWDKESLKLTSLCKPHGKP